MLFSNLPYNTSSHKDFSLICPSSLSKVSLYIYLGHREIPSTNENKKYLPVSPVDVTECLHLEETEVKSNYFNRLV